MCLAPIWYKKAESPRTLVLNSENFLHFSLLKWLTEWRKIKPKCLQRYIATIASPFSLQNPLRNQELNELSLPRKVGMRQSNSGRVAYLKIYRKYFKASWSLSSYGKEKQLLLYQSYRSWELFTPEQLRQNDFGSMDSKDRWRQVCSSEKKSH